MTEQKKPEVGEWCVEHEGGNQMTDKTREDLERWAKNRKMNTSRFTKEFGGEYLHSDMQIAWSAYQQGIADARKPSTETAAEWIARHQCEYDVPESEPILEYEPDTLEFISESHGAASALLSNHYRSGMPINLETASDCIKLCELLRVVPVERTVNP